MDAPNAFVNQQEQPTKSEVASVLGASRILWDQLITDLRNDHGIATQEWKSVSSKHGWSLRLKREDRTILYLSPSRGHFTASFVLGDKAVRAVRASSLPPSVLKAIGEARRYAEGTGIRLLVKQPADVAIVKMLVFIKLEH